MTNFVRKNFCLFLFGELSSSNSNRPIFFGVDKSCRFCYYKKYKA